MFGSRKVDWKKEAAERDKEGRDRLDEIRVKENEKTVC